jgi:RNA polymerase sigma-70 factor (ECF subfamily)
LTDLAHEAVVAAVRTAYGRLIAYLSARTRDIAAAEDALSAALEAALETWPARGVPDRPEAWLLTAARNRLKDGHRRARIRAEAVPTLLTLMDEAQAVADEGPSFPDVAFPDERLKLMFVCTHPAIAAGVRTPLMLQTVLGLTSERIAAVFLVKPAAMAQRLTRAKTKIRDAGIGFDVPEAAEWPVRLGPLCDAIYATYGLGWGDYAGEDEGDGLSGEAIALGFALYELLGRMERPAVAPELNGLLALMLYCEARRAARYDASGRYVALSDQDPRQWDRAMIERGDALLTMAQKLRQFGRYQLEAAIQSAHLRRGLTGVAVLDEIVILYEGLLRLAPSLAARVGHAAAVAEAKGAEAGLALLDALDGERLKDYQPYWAVRAHVLQKLGRPEAHAAFDRAIGLSRHEGQRAFLLKKQTAAREQNRDG